ncbi:Hypothetical_protein [Hexamita inflata]|uniref:Hypothetical_protein n=1 Tax=Hexamita inflata TaxID=28002 RepID=A0AA86NIV0_9EUKA|nr:Hypothetical protein HINF_LOCUS8487 [Hexamita inflata]
MLLHLEEAPSEERVNARFFCAFIGFRASLGLFLLGRQVLFSLFQDIFNVLDFLQRFNFLLEYSAMIFRYEISLEEGLHNNHQVGLYLRDLHVCVVFCVVLYNIFKFAAQSFLVQFGLKLFFRDHLSNFASLLFNLTQRLHVSFDFNVLLGKIGFYLTFNFYVLVSQKFKSFHAKVFSFNWSLGSLLGLGLFQNIYQILNVKQEIAAGQGFFHIEEINITTTITLSTWNTLNYNDYKHSLKFHFFYKFSLTPVFQRRVRLLLYGRFMSHIALIQTFNKILSIISIIITDLAFIILGMKIVLGHNKMLCC